MHICKLKTGSECEIDWGICGDEERKEERWTAALALSRKL
jgi:hypothetical protein